MIDNGNSIGPYLSHSHEHTVTKCLHEKHAGGHENGGSMAGMQAVSEKETQTRESFSLRHMVTDGWKDVYAKTTGILGKIWNDAGGEEQTNRMAEDGRSIENSRIQQETLPLSNAAQEQISVKTAAEATTTVAEKTKERIEETRNTKTKTLQKAGAPESEISGGLKKEQEGVRKFLQNVGKNLEKVGEWWKEEPQEEVSGPAKETDWSIGDNSYLLDSYDRAGQYSTLAKDRSRDGNFKARG